MRSLRWYGVFPLGSSLRHEDNAEVHCLDNDQDAQRDAPPLEQYDFLDSSPCEPLTQPNRSAARLLISIWCECGHVGGTCAACVVALADATVLEEVPYVYEDAKARGDALEERSEGSECKEPAKPGDEGIVLVREAGRADAVRDAGYGQADGEKHGRQAPTERLSEPEDQCGMLHICHNSEMCPE